jgi:hypothetical protein
VDLKFEAVVKATIIHDGLESCTAGFLPDHVDIWPKEAANLHGKFGQIIELYYDDDMADNAWANKSHQNHGLVSFHLLDEMLE